ncbi:hypothetical protein P4480_28690 [Bacillus thuringiensis]
MVRGLKFFAGLGKRRSINVAPLVGAWIEIIKQMPLPYKQIVASHVGAWIEICYY